MINQIKSVFLLGSLSALFMALGYLIGDTSGMTAAFMIALVFNGGMYYFSDSLVLSMYRAQPLDQKEYPWIYQTVEELASNMRLPMPRLWIISTPVANAFATGRNPSHASIAVTSGILGILDKDELRGVLAHELSHVKNRDTLLTTMAATLASAIGYLCNMLMHMSLMRNARGYSRDDQGRQNHLGFIGLLAVTILMPFAATLLQLALSRSREYLADETGAHTCHDPLALASALKKLHANTARAHFDNSDTARASTASLFIVNPFTGQTIVNLLSTHPPLQERISRLEKMSTKLF